MPKRIGFLYDKMLDKEFIRNTIFKASKHKTDRRVVRHILDNIDDYVDEMYDILLNDKFVPATPKEHDIYDSSSQKIRTIKVVPFWPDSVMHWLLVEAMRDVLMRGMYHWSCASIPERGGQRVMKHIKSILKNDPKGTKYAEELDVKHFYQSISVKRLMKALRRKIKDKRFLKVVEDILKSCGGGLAIGYYICQWLANFYLEPLDHFIMSLPGVKYMTRYMDNITLFGPNKKKLHRAHRAIEEYLQDVLDLKIKENWQIYPVSKRKVSAVGYRFARTHVVLRKRNFLRLTRQCRRVKKRIDAGKSITAHQAAGLLSRAGQLKHCDSHNVRTKYIDPIGVKYLKEVVKNESKRRQCA